MEQVKHLTAAENSVKRYESPRSRVIFVKTQGMLCGSPGNESMGENDISDAFHQD